MYARAHEAYARTDRETAVSAARPVDLVVLVLQRTLDHLRTGRDKLIQQEDSAEPLTKALQLINAGLMACLDREQGGDIAVNLGQLYDWASREIMMARLKRDGDRISEVIRVLETVSSAWVELAAQGMDRPVSAESPTAPPLQDRSAKLAAYQAASSG